MKRTYISPEYTYTKVSGLLNMKEQSNYFGSKMMETPNRFTIDNGNISYYQNESGEQINYNNEIIKNPSIIDIVSLKKNNHVIYRDMSVGSEGGQISWIIEITLFELLSTYCFGNIKKNRAFSGVLNSDVLNSDVNLTILDYVALNVINLYKLSSVDLYLQYNNLSMSNGMIVDNKFNVDITKENVVNISKINYNSDKSIVKLYFKQKYDYNLFSFDYFFNLNFEKI